MQLAQLHPEQWSQLDGAQGKDDARVFLKLIRSVDARYPLLDTVMRTRGFGTAAKDMQETWTAHGLLSSGVSFEHRRCKVFPFAYQHIDGVLWRSLRQGKLKGGTDRVKVSPCLHSSTRFLVNWHH